MAKKDLSTQKLDLITLSSFELMDLIETSFATPMEGSPGQTAKEDVLWGLPLLIEGNPGTAKTARIKRIAKLLKSKLFVFFAAPHPPESFAGALIPDGKGDAKNIVALSELRECIREGSGILFMDEINGAAPATQGAIQSLIHERRSGGSDIPGEIRIIAAQNPEEIATAGYRLSAPVANRFVHVFDHGPNETEWANWSVGGAEWYTEHTLESLVDLVTKKWPDVWPEVQGLFGAFMTTQLGTGVLHKLPASEDPASSRAWPSHRTWDFARRAWATSRIMNRSDTIRDSLVESCVGVGAAQAFIAYASTTKIPSPLDVLNNKWKIDTDRIDIVFAAYSSAAGYVTQRPDRAEQVKLAPLMWDALGRLLDANMQDIVVPSVDVLLKGKLGMDVSPEIKKAATKVLVPLYRAGFVSQTTENKA